jgi:microcystin-dependent protein
LGSDNFIYVPALPPATVQMFAGSAAPTGWLLCNGAAVSRTGNAALFAAIGTAFGVGDGSTTFNVPDLRGRAPIGAGQGAGLTNRALGAKPGEENHQLLAAELAAHAHALSDPGHVHPDPGHTHGAATGSHTHGVNDPQHSHTDKSGVSNLGGGGTQAVASSANVDTGFSATGITIAAVGNIGVTVNAAAAGLFAAATGITMANAGSNTAHNNMQPSLALNFIIKT